MAYKDQQSSDLFDIVSLVREWISKWYWFAISAVVCVVLAFVYTAIKKPVFEVKANLLISQSEDAPGGALGNFSSLFGGNGYVEDEVFIVSSHDVLKQVVQDLQINKNHIVRDGLLSKAFRYDDFPVDVFVDKAIADTLRGGVMFKVKVSDSGKIKVKAEIKKKTVAEVESDTWPVTVKTPFGPFVLNKTKYFTPGESLSTNITYLGYDAAAEQLAEDIECDIASQKSNVINLSTKSQSIDYAKDLLNTIILRYNQKGRETKTDQALQTARFIDNRLADLTSDLANSEETVQKYKNDNGIVDVKTETSINLNRREKYEAKLIEAETKLELVNMSLDFLSNPANAYSLLPTSSGLDGAESSVTTYNDLVLQHMQLAEDAKANNVALKKLERSIDAIRDNVIATLKRSRDNQRQVISDIRAQVRAADSKLGGIPAQERQFRDILRQQTIKEQLYVYLLQRREETQMAAVNALDKGIVIDEAYALNEPVGLKRKWMLALAFVFGLCIPPVIFYMRNLFRNKFDTRDEVEKLVKIPVLGEICESKKAMDRPLVVRPKSTSSAAELFRLVRSNLGFMMRSSDDKVVLITSTTSGEGKSFVSINLAASFALLGKRVLLIGMDIRNPQLAKYLGINPRFGLTQYLSGQALSVDDMITPISEVPGLDVIVAGPVPPNPSELLCETVVDDFINEMRQRYDYVIIDSAPVGMVSDTFSLDRVADSTVYVCRANYTKLHDLDFASLVYEQKRLKNMALVVNGTTATSGYGYGYGANAENSKGKKKKS